MNERKKPDVKRDRKKQRIIKKERIIYVPTET